jgi:hypothetical protein
MTAKADIKVPAPQVTQQLTTRFIIAHGDKGGVGKSMVARALVDYLHNQGEKVAIIDTDTQNPDVFRMFKGSVEASMANIREENGWMDVMDFVMAHPGYTFIMNTPAGIGEYMKADLVSFANFLSKQESPVEMELWWTMNGDHDSVNLFSKAYEKYGQFFSRVRVLCNLHFTDGNQNSYVLWNESPLRTRLEKSGGLTMFFPGLNIRVVTKLFNPDVIIPFSQAADTVAGEKVGLGPAEIWKLDSWLSEVAALFGAAFSHKVAAPAGK